MDIHIGWIVCIIFMMSIAFLLFTQWPFAKHTVDEEDDSDNEDQDNEDQDKTLSVSNSFSRPTIKEEMYIHGDPNSLLGVNTASNSGNNICSNGDTSIYLGMEYNDRTRQGINNCLSDRRYSVQQMCNIAQYNLNGYQNNIVSNVNDIQGNINIYKPLGSFGGAWWSYDTGRGWFGGQWDRAHNNVNTVINDLQNAYNACNNTNNQILNEAVDNCSNTKSIISATNICNIDANLANMTTQCNAAKQHALSANDNATVQAIQAIFAYNPVNATLGDINTTIANNTNYCINVYDKCDNPNTLLDVSGVYTCIGTDLSQAYITCQTAYNLAQDQFDISGKNIILQKWTDMSNGIIRQTQPNARSLLQSTRDFCTDQITMYTRWGNLEEDQASKPCLPEQSILPGWEPGLTNQIQQWNTNSLQYLASLSQRLDEIETYLQNRYNFLTFDPSHVSILPPGSLPMVTIEGNPPNQVLSMLIPQGMPGIQGPVGAAGGTGIIGNPGKAGPDGKVGIWELPTQYENTYSTV